MLVLTQISSDFKSSGEYLIPDDIEVYPNVLITKMGIMFPYLQGLTENDIYFYALKVSE